MDLSEMDKGIERLTSAPSEEEVLVHDGGYENGDDPLMAEVAAGNPEAKDLILNQS